MKLTAEIKMIKYKFFVEGETFGGKPIIIEAENRKEAIDKILREYENCRFNMDLFDEKEILEVVNEIGEEHNIFGLGISVCYNIQETADIRIKNLEALGKEKEKDEIEEKIVSKIPNINDVYWERT